MQDTPPPAPLGPTLMLPLSSSTCSAPSPRSQAAVFSKSLSPDTTAIARSRSKEHSCTTSWPTVPLAALSTTASPG